MIDLNRLIAALQGEVEKRRAVDEAAERLAHVLGVDEHDVAGAHGLHAVARSFNDDEPIRRLARRLRPDPLVVDEPPGAAEQ
jgi:hypothetical protein